MKVTPTHDGPYTVRVSRRIPAPADAIFAVLCDPRRHPEIDGSGMLRGPVTDDLVTGVGDAFVMRMHADHLGDYEMVNHVVDFVPGRRVGWAPESGRDHPRAGNRWGHRWVFELVPDGPGATVVSEIYDCSQAPADERHVVRDGDAWAAAMAATLERLDTACATAR